MKIAVNSEKTKVRRKELNLTKVKLAELSGLTPETISAIERGKKNDVRLSTINKLAKALQIDSYELIQKGGLEHD